MKPVTNNNKPLTTSRLKRMGLKKLIALADSMATRLQWLHSTGKDKENPETFKRLALEIYHLSEIIEWKETQKANKKFNFNK